MAKLSARGRTELARVVKTVADSDPAIESVTKYYALMSDKRILVRVVTKWRDHPATDRGWKVSAALVGGRDREAFLSYMKEHGYEEVTK